MRLVSIRTDNKAIRSAERVVEFHSSDLPAPGAGFKQFFEHIRADVPMSQEAFDEQVMEAYRRDEQTPNTR
jgi:hypothetical protein